MDLATLPEQRQLLLAQAQMIRVSSIESVPEPRDKADVQHQYDLFLLAAETKPTAP